MPAYCHPAAYAAFAREVPQVDTTAGLFRAAFAIARHEQPEADVQQAEATVADLAETVRRRVKSPNAEARLAHLHDVLFDVVGFIGNVEDYYNPANSYLPHVLRTRRGLPITLVLIYKCVAEGIGLAVRGINSPGHFLAAVECSPAGREFGPQSLLDQDEVGRRIAETTGLVAEDTTPWLVRATHRQWLSRMLNNLQAVFAHAGRERDLYAMQELQSLLDA
jgi:regulator of sirC expression with transglutaminase-like and TPR domain